MFAVFYIVLILIIIFNISAFYLPGKVIKKFSLLSSKIIDFDTFLRLSIARKEIQQIMSEIASSSVAIAGAIARAPIDGQLGNIIAKDGVSAVENSSGDKVKKLDEFCNHMILEGLKKSGEATIFVSEELQDPVLLGGPSGMIFACDPLDGSSNIDCAVATGTIFGIYKCKQPSTTISSVDDSLAVVLQPGVSLLAAGYVMYSSSTEMVVCLGKGTGVTGFTLDPATKKYILTRRAIQCPKRGPYYSLNEGRSSDWPPGLQRYIDDIKNGRSQWGKRYSSRYVCSLVADFHRTLLYGGWAGNPRSHLRLFYEAAPLAMIAEEAGGAATDGVGRLAEVVPTGLHQKTPVFMGSAEDIAELLTYGDVQQKGSVKYSA